MKVSLSPIRIKYILLLSSFFVFACKTNDSPENRPRDLEPNEPIATLETGLSANADVIRIKLQSPANTATEDGKTWDTAYTTLGSALGNVRDKETAILVVAAKDRFMITNAPDNIDFSLLDLTKFQGNTLEFYGGFKGDESDLSKIEAIQGFPRYPLILDAVHKGRLINADFRLSNNKRRIKFFAIEFKNGAPPPK